MRYITLILCIGLLASCSNADNKSANSATHGLSTNVVNNPATPDGTDSTAIRQKPTMDFTDTLFDFGSITAGDKVEHNFIFTNHGKSPLIITAAVGSCGCTAPSYPQQPVAAGASDTVKVRFNSTGKSGLQDKTVNIHSNALGGIHTLYIKANVQAAAAK
jgi:Protein of unknown function (DUF1573)